jgi:hypothetical protein
MSEILEQYRVADERYLVDFGPPGHTFGKKVNRIQWSYDQVYWMDVSADRTQAPWRRIVFYDGTFLVQRVLRGESI